MRSAPPPLHRPTVQDSSGPSASKKRWRYTLNKRDFGPFTGEQLEERILEADLPPDTPIFEEWAGLSMRLDEIPEFAEVLENIARTKASEALARETEETRGRVAEQKKSLARMTAGVFIFGAVALSVWLTQSPAVEGYGDSQFASSLFNSPPPKPLDKVAKAMEDRSAQGGATLESSELPQVVGSQTKRRNSARKQGEARGAALEWISPSQGKIVIQSGSTASSLNFDFDNEGVAASASPFSERAISNQISPRLASCVKAEAQLPGSFKGGVIQFTVLSSGNVGQVQLEKSEKVSKSFVRCVRRAFSGRNFGAFKGSARSVRIPVQVSI